jgi:hypothetical protein
MSPSLSITNDYGTISFIYLTKSGTKHTIGTPAIILVYEIMSEEIAIPTRLRYAVLFDMFFLKGGHYT